MVVQVRGVFFWTMQTRGVFPKPLWTEQVRGVFFWMMQVRGVLRAILKELNRDYESLEVEKVLVRRREW